MPDKYRDLCAEAELVLETSLLHSDQVHIRLIASGDLLCRQPRRRYRWVQFLSDLPHRRALLPPDLHIGCRMRIPI